mgnify:FL=1
MTIDKKLFIKQRYLLLIVDVTPNLVNGRFYLVKGYPFCAYKQNECRRQKVGRKRKNYFKITLPSKALKIFFASSS